MIEILEAKNKDEKEQLGISGDSDRMFVFRDRTVTLGVIQFSVKYPMVPLLLKLEVIHTNGLTSDLIFDGLIRTACHTFQRENLTWIIADEKMVREHVLLSSFFEPLLTIKETMPDEITAVLLTIHPECYVMKTDMIYKGCCK